jgi:hypothetical protein
VVPEWPSSVLSAAVLTIRPGTVLLLRISSGKASVSEAKVDDSFYLTEVGSHAGFKDGISRRNLKPGISRIRLSVPELIGTSEIRPLISEKSLCLSTPI